MSAMSAARSAHASAAPRARADASTRRDVASFRAHAARRARSTRARASSTSTSTATANADAETRMVTIEEMSGEVFPSNLR